MSLAAGSRLGAYEIVAQIGQGGMGEVYRATDTRLKRQVALKVLPAAFVSDPERIARFQREAEVLATLNHPNIAQIYGIEEANGVTALVLELVEGPTLADRIAKGPLPLDEALPLARQIAEALEAAHDQGIVHRDLKPANIKVRDDGAVKVLDFGLAKLAETQPTVGAGTSVLANSPTITSPALMTGVGVLLGTAAYMSPEQAKGRPADKRTDIWAFGCVLFEMLTGKRAFDGEDVADALANVLKSEPALDAIRTVIPRHLLEMLEGCLEKDRKRRISDFSTIRFVLEHLGSSERVAIRSRPIKGIALGIAVAIIGAGAVVGWRVSQSSQVHAEPTRLAIVPPPDAPLAIQGVDRDIAMSPDGRLIAYRGGPGLQQQLFLRRLDQLAPMVLPGTSNVRAPFFSSDGKWVGFWKEGVFYKIATNGGRPISLAQPSGPPRGASWGDDNGIVLATNDPATGLLRVPAGGGDLQVLTRPDSTQHEVDHQFPFVLPGSRAVLFTILSSDGSTSVAALDIKTGQRKLVLREASQAEYAGGYLTYVAGGTLRAVRFDLDHLDVVGDPVPVTDEVLVSTPARALGAANFVVSRTGTLLYVPTQFAGQIEGRSLVWVDRAGRQDLLSVPSRPYVTARLSPDDSQIALEVRDQQNDISILDLTHKGAIPRRLTFDRAQQPVWSSDGKWIIFASARTGAPNLFRRAADGSGGDERLTSGTFPQFVDAIRDDGEAIGFEVAGTQYLTRFSLAAAVGSQARPSQDPNALVSRSTVQGLYARLSPDGHYIAYQSADETGGFEVFVRPFPNLEDGKWQISAEGGVRPVWSRDGTELFFFHRRLPQMLSVPTRTSGAFTFGTPAKVFDWPRVSNIPPPFDVSKDGRFLIIKENVSPNEHPAPNLIIVEHWLENLRRTTSQ
jgi:serine/threonine-protein kinase